MLISHNVFMFMSQLPLVEAGQLLLVTGVAFAIITLIASAHRFHKMIELTEEELETVENLNDFFFIQVTRYLSKINRKSAGFGVVAVQFKTENPDQRQVQESLLHLVRGIIREDCDKACLLHEDCVGIILDTDEDRAPQVATRLTEDLAAKLISVPEITMFRAGASAYPKNALSSQQMIDAATEAMELAPFDRVASVCIAESTEISEPELQSDEEDVAELSKQDKDSAIDSLTGVLKADTFGSYMRKYLADIRYKKNSASVLCVGINRTDNIIKLHGENAADTVIAGVSEVLKRLTRDNDLIGRYGRDEFIILAECSMEQGKLIAIRLREAVQKEHFLFEGRQIKTSISVGVSAHPEHGRNLRDLSRGAYAALSVIRSWDTSSCLVYDPAQHNKKNSRERAPKTRR